MTTLERGALLGIAPVERTHKVCTATCEAGGYIRVVEWRGLGVNEGRRSEVGEWVKEWGERVGGGVGVEMQRSGVSEGWRSEM